MADIKFFVLDTSKNRIIADPCITKLLYNLAKRINNEICHCYVDNTLYYTCNICTKNFDKNFISIENHAIYHLNESNMLAFL